MSEAPHSPASIRVLLPEGSSISARQAIAALGPLGYRIDICDPDPLCLCRFSRFTSKFHRSPVLGKDPLSYWKFILALVNTRRYDVLLPIHEQAFLFSRVRNTLLRYTNVAVADFKSFQRMQSKAAFTEVLDELNLPHPPTTIISDLNQLGTQESFPYYIKTEFGTAGSGVWLVGNKTERAAAVAALGKLKLPSKWCAVIIQQPVEGVLEVAQSVFSHAELVAAHCYQQQAQGVGGSASARIGVDRPEVEEHLRLIGRHLNWHGSLMLDYMRTPQGKTINYIEANPRLGETMNATLNGVNLADLLVRVSLNQKLEINRRKRKTGVASHTLMGNLLGIANRGGSRIELLGEIKRAIFQVKRYAESEEEIAKPEDAMSWVPLVAVSAELLFDPDRVAKIARKAVSNYSLTPTAIAVISNLEDTEPT